MKIETENFGTITSEQQRQEVLEEHKASLQGLPAVYVGTYHKYNCGSLEGMWVDLTSFTDFEEFIEFCSKVLHYDEDDPELMAQAYEGFPEKFYNEGFMTRNSFDIILEYSELSQSDQEVFDAYCEIETAPTIEDFRDCYKGKYDTKADFARYFVEDTGELNSIPKHLREFFDFEAYAEFIFEDNWEFINGYIFLR